MSVSPSWKSIVHNIEVSRWNIHSIFVRSTLNPRPKLLILNICIGKIFYSLTSNQVNTQNIPLPTVPNSTQRSNHTCHKLQCTVFFKSFYHAKNNLHSLEVKKKNHLLCQCVYGHTGFNLEQLFQGIRQRLFPE